MERVIEGTSTSCSAARNRYLMNSNHNNFIDSYVEMISIYKRCKIGVRRNKCEPKKHRWYLFLFVIDTFVGVGVLSIGVEGISPEIQDICHRVFIVAVVLPVLRLTCCTIHINCKRKWSIQMKLMKIHEKEKTESIIKIWECMLEYIN